MRLDLGSQPNLFDPFAFDPYGGVFQIRALPHIEQGAQP